MTDSSQDDVLLGVAATTQPRRVDETVYVGFTAGATLVPGSASQTFRGAQVSPLPGCDDPATPRLCLDVAVELYRVFSLDAAGSCTVCEVRPDGLAERLAEVAASGGRVVAVEPPRPQHAVMYGSVKSPYDLAPRELHVAELVEATYRGDGLPDLTLSEAVAGALDLSLSFAFAGCYNCLGHLPGVDAAVPCAALETAGVAGWPSLLGHKWPKKLGGTALTLGFRVESSVFSRARGGLPAGYGPTPARVDVRARVTLVGLRGVRV